MCSRSTEIVDLDWPEPAAEARAHSERLIERIRARIDAAGGWIPFVDYMQAALYEPGLGYYSAGAAKLGAAGDFVTAPELSPLFSRCVANQCAQILLAGGGDTIVEVGAGTGAMAAAIVDALGELDAAPQRYVIVETSAQLRERQRATIAAQCRDAKCIEWLDAPPAGIHGVVIGNEVLDALPCERFVIADNKVEALGVAWRDDRFVSESRPAGEELARSVGALERELERRFANGFVSELRPAMAAYIGDWARRLRLGAMLWIDYGLSCAEYYSAQRDRGTLRCHYRHRAHDDPFVYPGLQDITAWVDFSAVAQAGLDAGLTLSGYTTQAHFLLACGMERQFTLARSATEDAAAHVQLSAAVQKLLLPGQMGERFRVLGLQRGLDVELLGFSQRDLAGSL